MVVGGDVTVVRHILKYAILYAWVDPGNNRRILG